ncbi:hypothetical protein BCR34DRAFT_577509 [Clohesyomyces aquaticus]|uniref:Autophagy-related protein 6 n=1 Tax=Clohesyomyces aquaticus TaxID=1231657 RepID=A0A1Y1YJZ9_9PLEO|nr:hypothetical protein BCR34DRAFT_577509 [Clohesyomyces aquaticus]
MGWLWSSSDSSPAKNNLDPSLRDFLANEAPTGPKPSLPSKPAPAPAKTPETPKPSSSSPASTPPTSAVPPQSQFKDGRYADLWRNYTPQEVLDERGKTEQDKLRDIVDSYNNRKRDVGRVALENCALEYLEQYNCFKNPSWYQVSTVCHAETRKFNKCYDLQTKFLKALGYLTMERRTEEESERIQMHADKLYQQLVEQEKLIQKAREEGKPIPKFESVLSKQNLDNTVAGKSGGTADGETDIWSQLTQAKREEYEKKLSSLPPEEQEIEKRMLIGELEAQSGMVKKVGAVFVEERINRMKRKEAGQATIGDTIKHLWGWK